MGGGVKKNLMYGLVIDFNRIKCWKIYEKRYDMIYKILYCVLVLVLIMLFDVK